MIFVAATALDDILEKELQQQVFELAQLTGWRRGYHTFDSRRSASGFPDLVLVRERVVFLELKRERTRTTEAQKAWLGALAYAGAEVYVVRPRNLEQLAHVLAGRRQAPSHRVLSNPGGPISERELRRELEEEIAR